MLSLSLGRALLTMAPARPGALMVRSVALHATRMQEADFGFSSAPRPPSEKQVQYAQRLAQQLGFELPSETLNDMTQCSNFIDEMLSKAPPSERQVAFAKQIATTANIELPEAALQSSKSISQYIEANQMLLQGPGMGGGMGMGMAGGANRLPTDKQITFAVSLAQRLNVGITAEALQSRSVLSSFIAHSQQQLRGRRGGTGRRPAPTGGVAATGPPAAAAVNGAAMGGAMGAMGGASFDNGFGGGGGYAGEKLEAVNGADADAAAADTAAAATGVVSPEDDEEAAKVMDELFGDFPDEGGKDETPLFAEGNIPF